MSITPDTIAQVLAAIAAIAVAVRGKKYVDDKVAAASDMLERAKSLARAAARPFLPLVGIWPEEKVRAELFKAIDRIAGVLRITLTPKQRADIEQAMEEELLVASFDKLGEQLKAAGATAGGFLDPKGRG